MKAVKLHFIKTSTIDKSVVKLLFMVMMMIISNIEKKTTVLACDEIFITD